MRNVNTIANVELDLIDIKKLSSGVLKPDINHLYVFSDLSSLLKHKVKSSKAIKPNRLLSHKSNVLIHTQGYVVCKDGSKVRFTLGYADVNTGKFYGVRFISKRTGTWKESATFETKMAFLLALKEYVGSVEEFVIV